MSKAVFRRMLLREEMGRRPSWGSGALWSPSSQFQLWCGTRLGGGSLASLRVLGGCAVLPTVLLHSAEPTCSEPEVPQVGAKGREAFGPRPKKGTVDTPEWPAVGLLAPTPRGLL